MGKSISINVGDISTAARQSLERIIESPLASDEQVIIMTYTPGVTPDESAIAEALARLNGLRNRVAEHQQAACLSSELVEETADEAIDAARNARRT